MARSGSRPELSLAQARPLPAPLSTILELKTRPGGQLFYRTQPPLLIGGLLPGETPGWYLFSEATQHGQVIVLALDHGVLTADGQHILYATDTT